MKKKIIVLLLSLIPIVLLFSWWDSVRARAVVHPILVGSYQSDSHPSNMYQLTFDQDGVYWVYAPSELVEKGTYEQVLAAPNTTVTTPNEDNTAEVVTYERKSATPTYLLKSDIDEQLLVLLGDDSFYYHAPNGEVYLMKNLSKEPTYIGQSE